MLVKLIMKVLSNLFGDNTKINANEIALKDEKNKSKCLDDYLKTLTLFNVKIGENAVKTGYKIGDKDVYVQRFNCGTGPATNSSKNYDTGLSNVTLVNIAGRLAASSDIVWPAIGPGLRIRFNESSGRLYFDNAIENLTGYTIYLDIYFMYK